MDRWDDLKFLLAISKHGTMASAARELNTNPATVSRRMERLGDELGVTPIIKTQNGWGPNPELQSLIRVSDDFFEAMRREKNMMRLRHGQGQVRLRLACSPVVSKHVLFPNLPHFREELRNIQLTIHDRIALDTLSGNDLIISWYRPQSGRVIARKVGEINICVYRNSLQDEGTDWVGLNSDIGRFAPMGRAEEYFGVPASFCVGSFDHIMDVMQKTQMSGILPTPMGEKIDEFEAVPGSEMVSKVYLSYHESRKNDPAIEAVGEFVTHSFKRFSDVSGG
nr:LysR family transcriptional regulator [uncultured Celeribacter sp.]